MLLWVKDAPKVDVNSDGEITDFIDRHVTSSLPDKDEELKKLVLKLQTHSHSSYCRKRKGSCRFSFPRPPSTNTLIVREPEDDERRQQIKDAAANTLKPVHALLLEDDTSKHMTLEEICTKADIAKESYTAALAVAAKGKNIILRRRPCEQFVNGYNPVILQAWGANMDVQYILDAYACVMYVAAYMTKDEQGLGELLKQACNENDDQDIKKGPEKSRECFP